jgi:hypothetical protein
MTRTPIPSPRGTNYERLYLANSLAHDAAIDPDRARNAVDRRRGRARDEEPDDELSEIVTEMQGLFRKGLANEDVTRADQLLEQLLGFCGGGEAEDDEAGNDPNQQNMTGALRDRSRGMDRRPSAADFAGGGLGLDRKWPSRGGDARAEARAESEFTRMFGPPPRQV